MTGFQQSKTLVRKFRADLDSAHDADITAVIGRYTTKDYHWRGMHPFYEQHGAEAVAERFWKPLRKAIRPLQRREDIFLAGKNDVKQKGGEWVCSMGHLMGLFDEPWLGIRPSGKMVFLRYCEFHCVTDGKIGRASCRERV